LPGMFDVLRLKLVEEVTPSCYSKLASAGSRGNMVGSK